MDDCCYVDTHEDTELKLLQYNQVFDVQCCIHLMLERKGILYFL